MDKKQKGQHNRFIIHTAIASVLLSISIAVLVIVYNMINIKNAKESCYQTLTDMSAEACSKIENNFKNDKASLRMLSKIISQSDDVHSTEVINQLAIYPVNSYITNIAILTSSNELIEPRHINIDASDILSYDDEIAKGEHISGLQRSAFIQSEYVIRNYIPVKNNSSDNYLLFTEMDPNALAQAWKPSIYQNHANFCIIDRNTGDIVINNWSELSNNINDLNISTLSQNIKAGKTGYDKIEISDGQVFAAYRPMNIEQWEIMFIIDEDSVLADVNKMHQYFMMFAAIGIGIFLLYLTWLTRASTIAIHTAKQSGNVDTLTELPNRNSYEDFCTKHKLQKGTACVYVDVDGLHEINNEKGHLAGDMMLKFIAETLKMELHTDTLFRIGGDEFAAFLTNRYDTKTAMQSVSDYIVKGGYHISYGISISNGEPISETIKSAEKKMYNMKADYYKRIGQPMRNKMEK